jgi:integrase
LTLDLFSPGTEATALSLRQAFDAWVAHRAQSGSSARSSRALRDESVQVYADMWQVFTAWCMRQGLDLETIDEASLTGFLDSLGGARDATVRYAKRMLRLVHRVALLEATQRDRELNPAFGAVAALPRYRFADTGLAEPLPEFLTASQARHLIAFLTERPVGARQSVPVPWQEVRNRTAVALQLGAGLTPGESRDLDLDSPVTQGGSQRGEPWAIAVPANGNYPARQTPLARWAGRQLRHWLEVRSAQAIPGPALFPSVRNGKPWSKASSAGAFQAVLQAAGIPTSGGSFKLRHTFALRQLTRHDPETVARWLGVQDPAIMERYQRVLFQPVDVV